MVWELHSRVGYVYLSQVVYVRAGQGSMPLSVILSYLYTTFKQITLLCLSVTYLISSEFNNITDPYLYKVLYKSSYPRMSACLFRKWYA